MDTTASSLVDVRTGWATRIIIGAPSSPNLCEHQPVTTPSCPLHRVVRALIATPSTRRRVDGVKVDAITTARRRRERESSGRRRRRARDAIAANAGTARSRTLLRTRGRATISIRRSGSVRSLRYAAPARPCAPVCHLKTPCPSNCRPRRSTRDSRGAPHFLLLLEHLSY